MPDHSAQRARAHDLLHTRGLDRALFANPATVTWLTGVVPPVQTGPNPFAGGPPLVWYEGGEFTFIAMSGQSAEGLPTIHYTGYSYEAPLTGADQLAALVRDLVARSGLGTPRVAIEARHLPVHLAPPEALAIDGLLDPLRMIKTEAELAALRTSFALTDGAHATARRAAQAGKREIDVWAAIRAAVDQAAGERVPLGNDCVVSYRENNIGGWPGDLELRPGDSLIVDLSVRWRGYWSDSCSVCYIGEPSARQKTIHRIVQQALEYALSLVKPGVPAGALDRQVRQFIADAGYPVYPHHTGHSVGVLAHEEPRVVPYNDIPLEPGMVILLEPGIYFPKEISVRLEDAVLVTPDGAEILTHHDKTLP